MLKTYAKVNNIGKEHPPGCFFNAQFQNIKSAYIRNRRSQGYEYIIFLRAVRP